MRADDFLFEELRNAFVDVLEIAIYLLLQSSFILKTPKGTLITIDPYIAHSVNQ
jgi:hypothetical protein